MIYRFAAHMIDLERLAKTIESTLLKPTASCEDVTALCTQAIHYGFAGVCVAPTHAKLAVEFLAVSDIKVVSVAGFPLGNQTTTQYNALGSRTVITDADGLVTRYFYDGWRVLTETDGSESRQRDFV